MVLRSRFKFVAEEVLRLKRLKSLETQAAAKRQIRRLIQNFGRLSLRQVTEERWTDYVLRERQRRERTFYDDRKYMRMILLYAKRKELVASVIQLPIPDLPWNVGREVTPDELARLEANASATLRFQIQIGWKMGLRLREMLRLRWAQFDWERGTVRLGPTDTKTRRAREIPLPSDLMPEFLARRGLATTSFVFPAPGGRAPQGNNKTAWRRLKRKTGIAARWHDLRHTCATVMLRRRVPVHIVRRYLGMSESVLTRIYLHLSTEDLRQAADAMSSVTRRAS